MNKVVIIIVLNFIFFTNISYSQINVNSSGKVGINQSYPSYNLDWSGDGRYQSGYGAIVFDRSGWGSVATIHPEQDWFACLGTSSKEFNVLYVDHVICRALTETSDETMKENIKRLDSSLEKLKKLRGVSYDLKKKYFGSKDPVFENKIEKERKNKIGFLAQELKEVFPEVVFLDTTNNLYSVNYSRLVPVLVEAIKEQQIQIEKLQENEKTIATLLKDIEELKTQISSVEENCCNSNLKNATINDIEENIPNQTAKLFQNSPNPFSNNTEIRCFIPSESIVAYICIYDMTGQQLQQHKLDGRENQSLTITSSELKPGMYLYSLIIDGKIIDSKNMILTNS